MMHVVTFALILSLFVMFVGAAINLSGDYQTSLYYIGATVFWVGAAAVLATGITAACAFGGSLSCGNKADDMGRDWRYGLAAGCRVETDDGRFVPIDNLRITNEERS